MATPAFKNKDVINFYEDAAEDLSMLRDIISHRSVTDETRLLLLNQTKETERCTTKNQPSINNHSNSMNKGSLP